MAIIPYLNVRASAWKTSVTAAECQLPYYGYIINPIPAIGTVGSFVIRAATVTPPNIYQIPAVKKGDKLKTSDGYTYYATEDVQAANEGDSITIPVTPAMQATHANQTRVNGAAPKFIAAGGCSVIRQLNPQTKTLGSNQDYTQCRPYVQPWPWDTDPCGIPWDKDNLLALSFYAPNFPSHKDYDVDFASLSTAYASFPDMIPVPRTIGAEYTPMTPRYFAAQAFGPRGYYGANEQAFGYWRTNTDVINRSQYAQLPTDSRWRQMKWRPLQMKFETRTATAAAGGIAFTTSSSFARGNPGLLWPGTQGAWAVPGSRGGRYSFGGWSSVPGAPGTYSGVTVQVWQENPGFADVMLFSAHVNDGHTGPPPITTGTWSSVVLPTVPGSVVKCYMVIIPDIGVMANCNVGGYICVSESTQVPWCHHVVTGNLVAPGGLIAPFY